MLLRLLIGLHPTDGGSICFDGRDVVQMDDNDLFAVRRRISMMFQGSALFDSLTVGENVALIHCASSSICPTPESGRGLPRSSGWSNLAGSENQLPSSLSGGMKKHVERSHGKWNRR